MPSVRVPRELRRQVAERADDRCEYCQSQAAFTTQSFSVDHIIPVDLGGSTTSDNVAFAWQGCNSHKFTHVDGIDTTLGQRTRLFHPRLDRWDDHFGWSEDYTLVVGLTAIGRATVGTLKLNRPGLINLRRVLREVGKHPPRKQHQES